MTAAWQGQEGRDFSPCYRQPRPCCPVADLLCSASAFAVGSPGGSVVPFC